MKAQSLVTHPSLDDVFSAANEVLNRRGWLVIGTPPGSPGALFVGKIVDSLWRFKSPIPFRIVAETDVDDWLAQVREFKAVRRQWGLDLSHQGYSGTRYFRVLSD